MTTKVRRPVVSEAAEGDGTNVGHSLPTTADLASAAWRRDAYAALDQLAASGVDFIVDDLVDRVGKPPRPRQLSGVFAGASVRGDIVQVGSTVSRDGRLVRVWRGAS